MVDLVLKGRFSQSDIALAWIISKRYDSWI